MTEEQALPRRPGVGARWLGGETHGAVLDGLHPPVAVDAGADRERERDGVREGLQDLREVGQDATLPAVARDQGIDRGLAIVALLRDLAVDDVDDLGGRARDHHDVPTGGPPDDRGGHGGRVHGATVEGHAGLLLDH